MKKVTRWLHGSYKTLEIGFVEPFDAFFNMFKVESKLLIFDLGFTSIIADDTESKLKFLSTLNLSFAMIYLLIYIELTLSYS